MFLADYGGAVDALLFFFLFTYFKDLKVFCIFSPKRECILYFLSQAQNVELSICSDI